VLPANGAGGGGGYNEGSHWIITRIAQEFTMYALSVWTRKPPE
jgi:hypothetical protein